MTSSAGPIDRNALDRAIYLNLQPLFRLIAGLLPVLAARPAARIVNITSGLAIAGSASTPVPEHPAGLLHDPHCRWMTIAGDNTKRRPYRYYISDQPR